MNATPANVPPIVNPAASNKRTLRKLFLTLFLRGRSSRGLRKEGAPKSVGQKLALTLVVYGGIGFLIASAFKTQPIFSLSVYLHAMTFVFLGMFVASSAGEVLFNKEEGDILMHRPVTSRELLWAKIGVMVEVSLWIAGAFNLAGLFYGMANTNGGWLFPVAHIASTILEALFCAGCIVMVYQLCLRWFGRERLDALMTTVQVCVAILFVLGGQLLPRLLMRYGGALNLSVKTWWLWILPPAWFAGFDDALAGSGQIESWVLAGWAILTTAVILWVAFGKLAGDYQTGLQTLSETNSPPRKNKAGRRWMESLVAQRPLCWWLRDPVERASFLLTAAYLFRDRDVKLRIYPSLAPMLVVPVILLTQGHMRGGSDNFGLAFAGGYIGLIPLLALNLLQYSQQWLASDIFRAAPLAGPAKLIHGARRAVLCLLTLPLMVAAGTIIWFLHNENSQLVLVLPGLMTLPIYALIPCLGGGGVPFSRPTEEAKSASRGVSMMGAVFVAMGLSAASVAAWSGGWFQWLVLGEGVTVIGLYVLMRSQISKAPWRSIE